MYPGTQEEESIGERWVPDRQKVGAQNRKNPEKSWVRYSLLLLIWCSFPRPGQGGAFIPQSSLAL
jgi:hypothetical protein